MIISCACVVDYILNFEIIIYKNKNIKISNRYHNITDKILKLKYYFYISIYFIITLFLFVFLSVTHP